MPRLKTGQRVTVAAAIKQFQELSGRETVTVACAGQRMTFDASWLPNDDVGDEVRLQGRVTGLRSRMSR